MIVASSPSFVSALLSSFLCCLIFMRVLIAGGAGFLGSHLVDYVLQQGADVYVIDNEMSGTPLNLTEAFALAKEKGIGRTCFCFLVCFVCLFLVFVSLCLCLSICRLLCVFSSPPSLSFPEVDTMKSE